MKPIVIKVIGSSLCAKCASTKKKLHHLMGKWNLGEKVDLVFFNLEHIEGLAEGAFYDVDGVPATIIEKDKKIVARWDGVIPGSDELKTHLDICQTVGTSDQHTDT